jgi:asparagine synthase (glutamine-hydrolysing)
MTQFFALIWDFRDSLQSSFAELVARRIRASPERWQRTFESPGLVIFQLASPWSQDVPHHVLSSGHGLVAGTLFRRIADGSASRFCRSFTQRESDEIRATRARALVDDYWGAYVAFVRGEQPGEVSILRDPSGAIPCYVAEHEGAFMAFSCAHDCLKFCDLPFSVDWQIAAALVAGVPSQTPRTIAREVMEVQPGESVSILGSRLQRCFHWDAVSIAAAEVIEDSAHAIRELRLTVTACVQAWASCHSRIIHSLSGGLDSSIVLACLKTAPSAPDVTCLNVYSEHPEGDERRYARKAMAEHGYPLIERLLRPEAVNLRATEGAVPSLSAPSYSLELLHGPFETELAKHRSASTFLQGAGGDQVFLQVGGDQIAADYVSRHGPRLQLLRVAHDSAVLTKSTLWSAARRGLANGLRAQRWRTKLAAHSGTEFVRPDVLCATEQLESSLLHPLIRAAKGIPEGKLFHIFLTISPPGFSRPFLEHDRPPIVFPLLSQPVQELCLRIPTYVLLSGGWDRSIARQAFADALPAEIALRRGKGGGALLLGQIFEANLPYIRAALLDGVLVREGILDSQRLERYFRERQSGLELAPQRVLMLWEREMFVRQWATGRYPAAA